MKYQKKPATVEAVKLTRRITVHTSEGDMVGEPGDWLVTEPDGRQYPVKDDAFQRDYAAVLELRLPEPVKVEPVIVPYPVPYYPPPSRPWWDNPWANPWVVTTTTTSDCTLPAIEGVIY